MSDPEARQTQISSALARDRMRSRRVAIGQPVTPPAIGSSSRNTVAPDRCSCRIRPP
jgi:hypothetical protein